MSLYARPSWKLFRQVGGDLFVLGWAVLWWFVGRFTDSVIRALAEPARLTEKAARAIRDGFNDAAKQASQVPGVGDDLRKPFDGIADNITQVLQTTQQQITSIEQVATLTGWLAFLIPVSLILAIWLPNRIRFALNSAAAVKFLHAQEDLDLMALRAMATQPMHQIARISDDPVSAWRKGDRAVINRLAELELRRAGLRMPKKRLAD